MATTPSSRSGEASPEQPGEALLGTGSAGPTSRVEPNARRRPASAVPSISGLVISGDRATLIDISVTGLLAECGAALKVGQRVKVVFEGTFIPQVVPARVVRNCVASMGPAGFRYHLGIAFNAPIAFDDDAPESGADSGPATVAAADSPRPSSVVNRW